MSDIEFVLTIKINGKSLQEIDDGLIQAAGQRLISRMQNPPKINGKSVLEKAKKDPNG